MKKVKKTIPLTDLDVIVAWVNAHSESGLLPSTYEYEYGMYDTEVIRIYDLETFISKFKENPDKMREEITSESWYPNERQGD